MDALLRRTDIDAAFGAQNPSRAFAAIEEQLSQAAPADRQRLRSEVIDALEGAYKSGTALTADWFNAICESSPAYLRSENDESRSATRANEERLCRLLLEALEPMAPSQRGALLGSVISDLSDISFLCALLQKGEGDLTRRPEDSAEPYFGPAAEAARDELLRRITDLAQSNLLWTQASPSSILWFWFACGQEQEAYLFVKKSMRNAGALASLLALPLEPSEAGGTSPEVVAVRRWSKIIDFNTLEQRAVELLTSGASRSDRTRARRFLDAYANGKSDLFR